MLIRVAWATLRVLNVAASALTVSGALLMAPPVVSAKLPEVLRLTSTP